jgi:hypothetical protein
VAEYISCSAQKIPVRFLSSVVPPCALPCSPLQNRRRTQDVESDVLTWSSERYAVYQICFQLPPSPVSPIAAAMQRLSRLKAAFSGFETDCTQTNGRASASQSVMGRPLRGLVVPRDFSEAKPGRQLGHRKPQTRTTVAIIPEWQVTTSSTFSNPSASPALHIDHPPRFGSGGRVG